TAGSHTCVISPPRNAESCRAGNARSGNAAIAAGIAREILLVIRLGEVELAGRFDRRGDCAEAGFPQPFRLRVARAFREFALLVGVMQDDGAVLRAAIVALPHALRRIMVLPEPSQQLLVAHDGGIE